MTFRASPHSVIDKKFSPLLTRLKSFQEQTIRWTDMELGAEKDSEAKRLHEAYTTLIHNIPFADADNISETEIDLAFASGVLRALELGGSIIDDAGIVDTFSSSTLSHFCVDFRNGSGDRKRVHDALLKTLSIDEAALNDLEKEFYDAELQPLEKRKRVIEALDVLFDLHGQPKVRALFSAFYPSFDLPDTDIKIIRTATSIFFCIPFASVSHLTIKESKRSDDSLSRLWGNFSSQKQGFMAHFPVFGFFTGEHVEKHVLAEISNHANLTTEECETILTTMVSILPTEEVDKYIIHDIWGHQWQAHLFSFEKTYTNTAGFQKPPNILKENGGNSIDTLLQSALKSGHTETWKSKCIDYLAREYEERLIQSVSALFAEVLADAMEYKFLFLREDLREKMPSSSFLSELPAKLDLTLHDLPIYFRLAFRGISSLEKASAKQQIVDAFLKNHPESNPSDTLDSVNAFTTISHDLIASEKEFEFRDYKDGQIIMNAHAQMAFQFFELVEAYNDVFLSEDIHDTTSDIFSRHFDLLVFSTASFYERNREKHFWEIDTFVRHAFPPRYKKLQSFLAEESAL